MYFLAGSGYDSCQFREVYLDVQKSYLSELESETAQRHALPASLGPATLSCLPLGCMARCASAVPALPDLIRQFRRFAANSAATAAPQSSPEETPEESLEQESPEEETQS